MSTSESNNLKQDSDLADRDAYFSSPELTQRADLLRHLTENSNLIPLIRGVEGMGKTTFIQNLLDLAPENWIPVKINADVMLQPDALLVYLAGMFEQNDRGEHLFDDLILYFEDLRHDGFLPVIIVDDAHLLPEASVITLLRLHERSTDERPLAQILLFAEPEIDELLKTPQLRVMNLQSLQLLDMPEFTLEQTGLFLEHLLSAEGVSSEYSLTDSQIEDIHSEAGGAPGLIRERAQGLMASTQEGEIVRQQQGILPSFPMLGGGAVIIVMLLVLLFQDDINSLFSGEGDTDDALQSESLEFEGYKPLAIPDSEQMVISEPEAVVSVDQALPNDIQPAKGKESDLGPVSAEDGRGLDQAEALPQGQAVQPFAVPGSVAVGTQQKTEEKQSPPSGQKVGEKSAQAEGLSAKPVGKDGAISQKGLDKEKAVLSPSTDKTMKQPEIGQEKPDLSKQTASGSEPQISKLSKPVVAVKQPAGPEDKAEKITEKIPGKQKVTPTTTATAKPKTELEVGQEKSDLSKQTASDIAPRISKTSKPLVAAKQPAGPEDKAEKVTEKIPGKQKVTPTTAATAKPKTELEVGQKKSDLSKQTASDIEPQNKRSGKLVEDQPVPPPAKPIVESVASAVSKITLPDSGQSGAESAGAPVEDRSTPLDKDEAVAVSVINKPAASRPQKAAAKRVKSGLFREQWLLKQNPSSYTIQLVGLQDEKGIAKFVQRHSLTGAIAYYRTQRGGKPWYPLLYGVFSTMSRANAARDNLPESIVNSKPWIRTLKAVQKDIRAR